MKIKKIFFLCLCTFHTFSTFAVADDGPAINKKPVLWVNKDKDSPSLMYSLPESTSSKYPDISFYPDKSFSAKPSIVIDKDGLKINDKVICSWPTSTGVYDSKKSYNMVLGYSNSKLDTYIGCPADVPIFSIWGDNGVGTATLIIATTGIKEQVGTIDYQGKKLFLKITKEFTVLPSENAEKSREKNERKIFTENLKIQSFLKEFKNCLATGKASNNFSCIEKFIPPKFYFTASDDYKCKSVNSRYITPAEFSACVLDYQKNDSCAISNTLYNDLADCAVLDGNTEPNGKNISVDEFELISKDGLSCRFKIKDEVITIDSIICGC